MGNNNNTQMDQDAVSEESTCLAAPFFLALQLVQSIAIHRTALPIAQCMFSKFPYPVTDRDLSRLWDTADSVPLLSPRALVLSLKLGR